MKPKMTDKKHEKEIVKIIKKNPDICFVDEIFLKYAGLGKTTFYAKKLNESNDIKESLEKNRIAIKQEMRGNWKKQEAGPALQVSAYKLMGTDDERKKLSQTFIEATGKDGKDLFESASDEELDRRIAALIAEQAEERGE